VQYSGIVTTDTRSMLFTPQVPRHTVNLVVIEGGAAFKERLGAVLRELRRNTVGSRGKALTQQEAADIIGTDTDTIGRWERGQNLPSLEVLAKIADAYQLPREKRWLLLDPPALPARVRWGRPLFERSRLTHRRDGGQRWGRGQRTSVLLPWCYGLPAATGGWSR
jgi:transcriptional regulator with XRE-family HTH domain